MKKTLLVILALVMVLAVCAGCGNAKGSAGDDAKDIGAITDDVTNDEGSSRDSISVDPADVSTAIDDLVGDVSGVTLDDLNTEIDSDASYRSAAKVPIEDMKVATGN